jgi:hypothetical protein
MNTFPLHLQNQIVSLVFIAYIKSDIYFSSTNLPASVFKIVIPIKNLFSICLSEAQPPVSLPDVGLKSVTIISFRCKDSWKRKMTTQTLQFVCY